METGQTSTPSSTEQDPIPDQSQSSPQQAVQDAIEGDYSIRRLLKTSAVDSIDRNLEAEDAAAWGLPSGNYEDAMRILAARDVNLIHPSPPHSSPSTPTEEPTVSSPSPSLMSKVLPWLLGAGLGVGGVWLANNVDWDFRKSFQVEFYNADHERIDIPINPIP